MHKKTIVIVMSLFVVALLLGPPAQAQEETGCTLTQGFWKNHIGAWPVTMLTVGGDPYTSGQLIGLLSTPPQGDATYILAKQLIAAQLNVLSGADSSGVAGLINDAEGWLIDHPLGSWPTGVDRQEAIEMANLLDQFNNGLSGVPHCEDGPAPPPPEPQPEPEPEPQD